MVPVSSGNYKRVFASIGWGWSDVSTVHNGTVAMANIDNPNSRPIDINEYTAMVNQSATTVAEMRLLVESVANLMSGVDDVSGLTDAMIEIETAMLDRFFLRMVGFLVIFFLILIASRFVWVRIMPKQ